MSFLPKVTDFIETMNKDQSSDGPNLKAFMAAAKHAGADPSTFSSALSGYSAEGAKPPAEHEVKHLQSSHDDIYGSNGGVPSQSHTAQQLGAAAALQAFQSQGGQGDSQELMGLAMGEAMKLFSAQGGSGDKSEIMKHAATMAMKLYMGQKSDGDGEGKGAMSMLKMFM